MGRLVPVVAAFLVTWGLAKQASAQAAFPPDTASAPPGSAPPPAPPSQAAPPGSYPPPPPGYGYAPPPPAYGYPPYGYQRRPMDSMVYQGGPVPAGFHLEERPRKGLIISGALLTGIPWALGASIVSGSNFPNSSGWLVVPVLGPWITLAARHDSYCSYNSGTTCIDDGENSAVRTLLVLDGLMQTAGAVMFIVGVSSPVKYVSRDFTGNLHFTPAPIGRQGYGGFLTGEF